MSNLEQELIKAIQLRIDEIAKEEAAAAAIRIKARILSDTAGMAVQCLKYFSPMGGDSITIPIRK